MNKKDVETGLQRGLTQLTPDVLDSVLSDCVEQKGTVILLSETKKKSNWMRRVAAVAAAFVILLGGALGYQGYTARYSVASTVSLDVNPSIEIQVNEKEIVLAVTARNEDGKKVIGDMDFRGNDLDVTVNALIGSMLRNGYLSEIANSILISVDSKDPTKGQQLQKQLTEEVNALLQTGTFTGSVLSQTVTTDAQLQEQADAYGITLGKAQLIQDLVNQNPNYTFQELAALSINELNLLLESGSNTAPANLATTGTASDKSYVGEAKAKAAALSHAGLTESDVTWKKTEMDYEYGGMVYEVEFYADGYEYSYDIQATTGEVLGFEKERDEDAPLSGSAGRVTAQVTQEEAKQTALSHAGLSQSEVTFVKCQLDWDDGRQVYEVEFWSANKEYDYEIDANTGKILSYDYDAEGYAPGGTAASSGSGQTITEAEAKETALNHAGVAESDVTFVKCQLDRDDGRQVYEVEFWNANKEYDYEIDANTGKILSYDYDAEGYAPGGTAASSGSGQTITEAKAKEVALSHAGVSESDVTFVKCQLDRDDGRQVYEVEFWNANKEYDYEIDATTGEIVSYDYDAEGYTPSAGSTSGSVTQDGSIGEEKAKSIALNHAGIQASDAQRMECKLERDDGIVSYEVEFRSGGYEYSYEILASTGEILSHEKERDD